MDQIKGAWNREAVRLIGGVAFLVWLVADQLPDDAVLTWETLGGAVVAALNIYLLRNGVRIPKWLGGAGFPTDENGDPVPSDRGGGVWSPEAVKSMFYVDGHDGPPPPERTG